MALTRTIEQQAAEVLDELIVKRGLSYVDAIAECERREAQARAPYRQAAAQLRQHLPSTGSQRDA